MKDNALSKTEMMMKIKCEKDFIRQQEIEEQEAKKSEFIKSENVTKKGRTMGSETKLHD